MKPWRRNRVRSIVMQLFENQSNWCRKDLLSAAYNWHLKDGGLEIRNASSTLGRVLVNLKDEGMIQKIEVGHWEYLGSLAEQAHETVVETNMLEESIVDTPEPETPPETNSIKPLQEIGEGDEIVYVYYNENDRKLAELEGRDYWECKVGRTTDPNVANRISQQGINTAISRMPIIGLEIHCDASAELEGALHASLRMAGADYKESIGKEWFLTSPERILEWYSISTSGISALDTKQ